MSSEKELVFVAGHNAIFGDKLRYYLYPFLLKRTKIDEPTISDYVTRVETYDDLFAIHRKELAEKEHAQKMVYKEEARRAGMTYKEYMHKLEKEEEDREKEIIRKITGDNSEDKVSDSDSEQINREDNQIGSDQSRTKGSNEKQVRKSYLSEERKNRLRDRNRAMEDNGDEHLNPIQKEMIDDLNKKKSEGSSFDFGFNNEPQKDNSFNDDDIDFGDSQEDEMNVAPSEPDDEPSEPIAEPLEPEPETIPSDVSESEPVPKAIDRKSIFEALNKNQNPNNKEGDDEN